MDTNTTIPFYFETPAGYTTIKAVIGDDLRGEAHATAQIAWAEVYREETGRVVGLVRKPGNRLAVIARV